MHFQRTIRVKLVITILILTRYSAKITDIPASRIMNWYTVSMDFQAIFLLICITCSKEIYASKQSKMGGLNFVQLAADYGHSAIEYQVITEDGYILKLFRILGKSRIPFLLMHGIFDSSDTWIARGNESLAVTLADQGHDVWVGNCRGNRYGRGHLLLNPEGDDKFWDFTFHEFGYFDLPAIIDTVLEHTAADKINAIGHSQGNTIFYVLTSTRPEYNDKVNLLIALAPICFLQNVQPPLSTIIAKSPILYQLATHINFRELFGENSTFISAWRKLCPQPVIGYTTCVLGEIFPLIGYDADELEVAYIPKLVEYFPSGTSTKNLNHFAQLSLRRKFARYDYDIESNFEMYNASVPPEYDLSAVKIAVALLVAANDRLSTVDDVAILRQKLPNVLQHLILPRRKMNHADFVLGKHMAEYLFPYVFDVIKKV